MKLMNSVLPFVALLTSVSSVAANDPTQYVESNDATGTSRAVIVGNQPLVHTTQILPRDTSKSATDQTEDAMLRLLAAIDVGVGLPEQIVKLNVYATDNASANAAAKFLKTFLKKDRPAISYVITKLQVPHALVAVDAVAATDFRKPAVERFRETDSSGPAEAAVLPAGPRVYISGQAEKGDGSLADATRQTMAGLVKTLEHLGLKRRDVVQLKAFLNPMKDSAIAVREMMEVFRDEMPPPIILVEWESSLPIEIELIAASPEQAGKDAPSIEYLTPPWMKGSPVFARVARLNHPSTIFISNIYGDTQNPDGVDEVRSAYETLKRVAEGAGSDLRHLAKATYYVSSDDVSNQLNVVRPEFYDAARPPAASKAKVAGTGREDRTLTFDMIAVPAGH